MNINLHIERLVLDGVNIETGDGHLLQSVVENELKRMLTDSGLSSSIAHGTALPRISKSGIQLIGNNTMQLGRKIAQSVYGRIGHE